MSCVQTLGTFVHVWYDYKHADVQLSEQNKNNNFDGGQQSLRACKTSDQRRNRAGNR